jgi:hypothetical protein
MCEALASEMARTKLARIEALLQNLAALSVDQNTDIAAALEHIRDDFPSSTGALCAHRLNPGPAALLGSSLGALDGILLAYDTINAAA